MPANLSRRELLAWLAAGAGAAGTGAAFLLGAAEPGVPSAGSAAGDTSGLRPPPTSTARSMAAPASSGTPAAAGERCLVVVELPGGNDGLSTVVPYGDGTYHDLRPGTAIAEADVIDLDGRSGFHPELAALAGTTAVVQGVGSFEPSGSHFEMQQRWWAGDSAVDADGTTGWIGRLADVLAPEPGVMRAMSITAGNHAIVRSARNTTMSIPGLDSLRLLSGADPDDAIATTYQRTVRAMSGGAGGDPLGRQRALLASTIEIADRLLDTAPDDDPESAGYTWSGYQQALWLAAAVVHADTGIRVVHVQLDGDFDTHEGHAWRHPELMREFAAGLAAFRADLDRRGLADRVLVATTSEFGRTIAENGNQGLDHGTASCALVTGPGTAGLLGEAPSLTALDDNGDQIATVPLESYLGGLVEGWLDVPATEVFGAGVDPLSVVTG